MIDPSDTEQLTRDLVARTSVTGTRTGGPGGQAVWNESLLAGRIHEWFSKRNIASILQEIPDGRKNVLAFLRGKSAKTVILMGHFDTVPPSPGQVLAPPGGGDDGFLYGRGSLDMKSGIAVAMKLVESWKTGGDPPDVSVLFVATCDEEVESRGVLSAVEFIAELKEGKTPRAAGLSGGSPCEFLGVVNVDYTTERHPGDPAYHVWNGTVGKMLAGVYVRGYQTHVGEYYRGFHAMGLLSRMLAAVDGNAQLTGGAPPPVTLKVTDAKEEYNVMTSPSGYAYFNIFSTGKTPAQLLEELRGISDRVIGEYLGDLNRSYDAYAAAAKIPGGGLVWEVNTRTYSHVYAAAVAAAGREKVVASCREVMSGDGPGDVREKSFRLVERLLSLSGDGNPVVVLCFLPPFYPYIAPDEGPLRRSLGEAILGATSAGGAGTRGAGGPVEITVEDYYPYISDMSYLRIEPEIRESLEGLTSEMPAWGRGYHLDFGTIAKVDLPVINVGPYGFGAHQSEERVEKSYTFGILPGLIDSIIRGLK